MNADVSFPVKHECAECGLRLPALLASVLLMLTVTQADAQSASSKLNVEVKSNTENMVGQSLVYEMKQEMRESELFTLTSSESDAMVIRVNTMPKNKDYPNQAAMYSIMWTFKSEGMVFPRLVDWTLGYTGSKVVEETARNLAAQTAEVRSTLIVFVEQWKKQKKN